MVKSRAKKRKIHYSDATNTRRVSYKYFPVDEKHSVAVQAGRCYKCRKVTTDFCFGCSRYVCKVHSQQRDDEVWCTGCVGKGIKRNVNLTYVG
jgi:hypothetical protein